jgi:hypothetical protein
MNQSFSLPDMEFGAFRTESPEVFEGIERFVWRGWVRYAFFAHHPSGKELVAVKKTGERAIATPQAHSGAAPQ